MPGAPLSLPEREEIAVALTTDPEASWAAVARRIGPSPDHGGSRGHRSRWSIEVAASDR